MIVAIEGKSNTKSYSHDNSCILGKNVHIFLDHDHLVNVFGYCSQGILHTNLQTVSSALAYDNPIMGMTVLLDGHQATYVLTMTNNLLCPLAGIDE